MVTVVIAGPVASGPAAAIMMRCFPDACGLPHHSAYGFLWVP
ncbi:hypothetical protein [Micromonospora wenchangensis]